MQLPNPTKYKQLILASLASLACLLTGTAPSRAATRSKLRIPSDYAAWSHVARCESGGWQVLGSVYPDPLGVTAVNWRMFGGRPMGRGPVRLRDRITAIHVADRLRRYYHIPIPDQRFCAAW